MKPVATQSSFWLFLVSSACSCGDCCHPVGLEGSLILTRRLTRYHGRTDGRMDAGNDNTQRPKLAISLTYCLTSTKERAQAWVNLDVMCTSGYPTRQQVRALGIYSLIPKEISGTECFTRKTEIRNLPKMLIVLKNTSLTSDITATHQSRNTTLVHTKTIPHRYSPFQQF